MRSVQPALTPLLLCAMVGSALLEVAAQNKLPVEPLGSPDIHVRIDEPVTVKGGYKVAPPQPLDTPDPKMPNDGTKGTVLIRCVVDINGRVQNASIAQSLSPQNDAAALEAVRKWRFAPTRKDGKPVAVKTTLMVVF